MPCVVWAFFYTHKPLPFITMIHNVGFIYIDIAVTPVVNLTAVVSVKGDPHIFCPGTAGNGYHTAPSAEATVVKIAFDMTAFCKIPVVIDIVLSSFVKIGSAGKESLSAGFDKIASRYGIAGAF